MFATVSSMQKHAWQEPNDYRGDFSIAELLESRGFKCVHRSASHNYGGGIVYWYVLNLVPLPEEEVEIDLNKATQPVGGGYLYHPKKDGKRLPVTDVKESERPFDPPQVAAEAKV